MKFDLFFLFDTCNHTGADRAAQANTHGVGEFVDQPVSTGPTGKDASKLA